MLSENIKTLRKQKGYSQQQLADKLNVVRQTVSKWEKGYSVPDADLLEKLADIFEVEVGELLGNEPIPETENSALSEVANQLTIFNEYLAKRTRTRKKIIKAIMCFFALTGVVTIIAVMGFGAVRVAHSITLVETDVKLECTLDGEAYEYDISYSDEHYMGGGFSGPKELVRKIRDIELYSETETYEEQANQIIAQIEDYFAEKGGTCKIIYQE